MKPYYEEAGITIYHGDCLKVLPQIGKFDLLLTDPPYGTTACRWDASFDVPEWWTIVEGNLSEGSASVVFAAQPFTTRLIMSRQETFRYCWIWEKQKPTNFLQARNMPLRSHEEICVFCDQKPPYFPQGLVATRIKSGRANKSARGVYGKAGGSDYVQLEGNFPRSVLFFETDTDSEHETAKPIALLEYLVLTYTASKSAILDTFMGSGTTLVAAKNLGRKAVGIELEERYCEIAANRLRQSVFNFEEKSA